MPFLADVYWSYYQLVACPVSRSHTLAWINWHGMTDYSGRLFVGRSNEGFRRDAELEKQDDHSRVLVTIHGR